MFFAKGNRAGPGVQIAPALPLLAGAAIALYVVLACVPRSAPASNTPIDVVTMEVGPRRVPCTGVEPTTCLRVRFLPDTSWILFHSEIESFSWEEGFNWRIEVQRTSVPNPPADGSSITYRLVRVLSRERAP